MKSIQEYYFQKKTDLTPSVPQQNKAQRAARPVLGRFSLIKFVHL